MNIMRRKKYIAIGATMAIVGASCVAGATTVNSVSKSNYDSKYSVVSVYNEASKTDAATEDKSAADIIKTISDSIDVTEKDVYKDETVYAFTDASGVVSNIIVNEHLKNKDGAAELTDVTDLKDIKNIKGYEEFTQDSDKLTWKAEGNDIYYQGTTDKALPVAVKVTYMLDGKDIAPSELAGKSGKVTVRFDYENTATVEKEIDGKKEKINVPFAAVTGMMLNSNFKNVEVTNGKVIEEGESKIVIGYALPGMTDSLGLTEDKVEIPEYFELTADVESFSTEMAVTLVANASGLDISGELKLDELDTLIETISGAGDDLKDGSSQVSSGASTISEKLGELSTGISTLDTGIGTLSSSVTELKTGVGTIDTSAQSINSGISALDTALNAKMSDEEKAKIKKQAQGSVKAAFAEGEDTYNTIYESAKTSFSDTINSDATVDAIYAGLYDNLYDTLYQAAALQAMQTYQVTELTKEMKAGVQTQVETNLKQLATGIAAGIATNGADAVGKNVVGACETAASEAAGTAAITGAEGAKATIAANIEAVQENGYSLVTGASALAAGTKTLNDSMPTLSEGVTSLATGSAALATGASQLSEGAASLATGAKTLKEGIETLNDEVIASVVEAYDGNVKAFSDRVTAIAEASTEYDTFTEVDKDQQASTKFIIKTEGIYAE